MAYSPRKNQQKLNERGRDRLIKSAVDSGAAVGVMGSVFDVLSKAEMLPRTPIKEEVQQDPRYTPEAVVTTSARTGTKASPQAATVFNYAGRKGRNSIIGSAITIRNNSITIRGSRITINIDPFSRHSSAKKASGSESATDFNQGVVGASYLRQSNPATDTTDKRSRPSEYADSKTVSQVSTWSTAAQDLSKESVRKGILSEKHLSKIEEELKTNDSILDTLVGVEENQDTSARYLKSINDYLKQAEGYQESSSDKLAAINDYLTGLKAQQIKAQYYGQHLKAKELMAEQRRAQTILDTYNDIHRIQQILTYIKSQSGGGGVLGGGSASGGYRYKTPFTSTLAGSVVRGALLKGGGDLYTVIKESISSESKEAIEKGLGKMVRGLDEGITKLFSKEYTDKALASLQTARDSIVDYSTRTYDYLSDAYKQLETNDKYREFEGHAKSIGSNIGGYGLSAVAYLDKFIANPAQEIGKVVDATKELVSGVTQDVTQSVTQATQYATSAKTAIASASPVITELFPSTPAPSSDINASAQAVVASATTTAQRQGADTDDLVKSIVDKTRASGGVVQVYVIENRTSSQVSGVAGVGSPANASTAGSVIDGLAKLAPYVVGATALFGGIGLGSMLGGRGKVRLPEAPEKSFIGAKLLGGGTGLLGLASAYMQYRRVSSKTEVPLSSNNVLPFTALSTISPKNLRQDAKGFLLTQEGQYILDEQRNPISVQGNPTLSKLDRYDSSKDRFLENTLKTLTAGSGVLSVMKYVSSKRAYETDYKSYLGQLAALGLKPLGGGGGGFGLVKILGVMVAGAVATGVLKDIDISKVAGELKDSVLGRLVSGVVETISSALNIDVSSFSKVGDFIKESLPTAVLDFLGINRSGTISGVAPVASPEATATKSSPLTVVKPAKSAGVSPATAALLGKPNVTTAQGDKKGVIGAVSEAAPVASSGGESVTTATPPVEKKDNKLASAAIYGAGGYLAYRTLRGSRSTPPAAGPTPPAPAPPRPIPRGRRDAPSRPRAPAIKGKLRTLFNIASFSYAAYSAGDLIDAYKELSRETQFTVDSEKDIISAKDAASLPSAQLRQDKKGFLITDDGRYVVGDDNKPVSAKSVGREDSEGYTPGIGRKLRDETHGAGLLSNVAGTVGGGAALAGGLYGLYTLTKTTVDTVKWAKDTYKWAGATIKFWQRRTRAYITLFQRSPLWKGAKWIGRNARKGAAWLAQHAPPAIMGAGRWIGSHAGPALASARPAVMSALSWARSKAAGAGRWIGTHAGPALSSAGHWLGSTAQWAGSHAGPALASAGQKLGEAGRWAGGKVADAGQWVGSRAGPALSSARHQLGARLPTTLHGKVKVAALLLGGLGLAKWFTSEAHAETPAIPEVDKVKDVTADLVKLNQDKVVTAESPYTRSRDVEADVASEVTDKVKQTLTDTSKKQESSLPTSVTTALSSPEYNKIDSSTRNEVKAAQSILDAASAKVEVKGKQNAAIMQPTSTEPSDFDKKLDAALPIVDTATTALDFIPYTAAPTTTLAKVGNFLRFKGSIASDTILGGYDLYKTQTDKGISQKEKTVKSSEIIGATAGSIAATGGVIAAGMGTAAAVTGALTSLAAGAAAGTAWGSTLGVIGGPVGIAAGAVVGMTLGALAGMIGGWVGNKVGEVIAQNQDDTVPEPSVMVVPTPMTSPTANDNRVAGDLTGSNTSPLIDPSKPLVSERTLSDMKSSVENGIDDAVKLLPSGAQVMNAKGAVATLVADATKGINQAASASSTFNTITGKVSPILVSSTPIINAVTGGTQHAYAAVSKAVPDSVKTQITDTLQHAKTVISSKIQPTAAGVTPSLQMAQIGESIGSYLPSSVHVARPSDLPEDRSVWSPEVRVATTSSAPPEKSDKKEAAARPRTSSRNSMRPNINEVPLSVNDMGLILLNAGYI